jgi:FMN phosphatase YigB (HAD superfamily)
MAKGDRRYYRRITELLGVEPQEILCVGDDPLGDCRLPSDLGWRAVLLDRQGRHAETRAGQIATVRTLEGLIDLLPTIPK